MLRYEYCRNENRFMYLTADVSTYDIACSPAKVEAVSQSTSLLSVKSHLLPISNLGVDSRIAIVDANSSTSSIHCFRFVNDFLLVTSKTTTTPTALR